MKLNLTLQREVNVPPAGAFNEKGTTVLDIRKVNELSEEEAAIVLKRCNGSRNWTSQMLALRPFADVETMFAAGERIWRELEREDWMEGFNHHPRIGDLDKLKKKFSITGNWSAGEQSGVAAASDNVLHDLRDGNDEYESKFGFIFILCATGKDASEMLSLLKERLRNDHQSELQIALNEHAKITRLRLEKLCQE